MFKKVLVDVEVIVHLPTSKGSWSILENRARHLEEEAKDLKRLLRDHRSQDEYGIEIRRIYETCCEFCSWEDDRLHSGDPLCCAKAQAEWAAENEAQ